MYGDGADPSLRELCHDLMEPAAAIRLLARMAQDTERGQDLRNRLAAIDTAAGQIAAICEHVLHQPERCAGTRLDLVADDVVARARLRYPGTIDTACRPVLALAHPDDIVRILLNILTNACRAAGPAGRVRVRVDTDHGRARLAVADSGDGLGRAAPARRGSGLGLEIIGALTLRYGGTVHLGVSDLGGLAVTVQLPAPGRSSS
jgi:signal transduction histidine kinase